MSVSPATHDFGWIPLPFLKAMKTRVRNDSAEGIDITLTVREPPGVHPQSAISCRVPEEYRAFHLDPGTYKDVWALLSLPEGASSFANESQIHYLVLGGGGVMQRIKYLIEGIEWAGAVAEGRASIILFYNFLTAISLEPGSGVLSYQLQRDSVIVAEGEKVFNFNPYNTGTTVIWFSVNANTLSDGWYHVLVTGRSDKFGIPFRAEYDIEVIDHQLREPRMAENLLLEPGSQRAFEPTDWPPVPVGEGNMKITALTYPEELDPWVPYEINCTLRNDGGTDTLWAHLIDRQTGQIFEGSEHQGTVLGGEIYKVWWKNHEGLSSTEEGKVEVGHLENAVKVIDDSRDYTITVQPQIEHTLTIMAVEGGTTDPPPGGYLYPEGALAEVTALPGEDYKFDQWDLDGLPRTENPINILMNTSHTLNAVFTYVTPPPIKSTLEGIITEIDAPIEGVSITCDGYAAVTDIAGFYQIPDIPAKAYTVTASKAGYKTKNVDIDLSAGGHFTLNISLIPELIPEVPTLLPVIASAVTGVVLVGICATEPSR